MGAVQPKFDSSRIEVDMVPMNDLHSELRLVIARYGLPAVHQAFQVELRQTFDYLRQIFEPPKNNLIIPVGERIPDRAMTPHHAPISSALHLPELDLDSEVDDNTENTSTHDQAQVECSVLIQKTEHDPTLKEVVIQAKREMESSPQEKFSKVKHKEDVAKKYKELTEKGIRPEDLLTKDNLILWLGQGMSYMRIAREITGVPDTQIAAVAKNFGLQSDIKKYLVMKKGGK